MKSKKPEQKKFSEFRKRAEEKLKSKITMPKAMSHKETRQLIHELQVHQIELEMQNDELRKAQTELEESRSRYSHLYDFAPVSYFTFDKHGLILEANLTAAKELGIERGLLINKPFRAYIVAEDRKIFDSHLQKVFKSADRETCEITLKVKNGIEFYAQLESIAANDLKGNSLCWSSVSDITKRKKIGDQIKSSLHEKEILLSEIHHRVKNNMQIISSLLKLHSDYIKDKTILNVFHASQNRIGSMALIHEKLYQSGDFSKIKFREYVESLATELYRMYEVDLERVMLRLSMKEMSFGINLAIPCGLIINELISNSLKYAFPGQKKGEIIIAMNHTPENEVEIIVSDDGIGMPEGIDSKSSKTLGLYLVTILVEDQLNGNITIDKTKGTEFRIKFKT